MFGKAKAPGDDLSVDTASLYNEILGDEGAAERAANLDEVATRLSSAEQQLSSQFMSMAAYAQIAQEQVELARSEARAENDQLEQRVVQLIERERSDRLTSPNGAMPAGVDDASSDERLTRLEALFTALRQDLAACVDRQKALADAITTYLAHQLPRQTESALPPPAVGTPIPELRLDGPDVS